MNFVKIGDGFILNLDLVEAVWFAPAQYEGGEEGDRCVGSAHLRWSCAGGESALHGKEAIRAWDAIRRRVGPGRPRPAARTTYRILDERGFEFGSAGDLGALANLASRLHRSIVGGAYEIHRDGVIWGILDLAESWQVRGDGVVLSPGCIIV